jgi:hypothetical protein
MLQGIRAGVREVGQERTGEAGGEATSHQCKHAGHAESDGDCATYTNYYTTSQARTELHKGPSVKEEGWRVHSLLIGIDNKNIYSNVGSSSCK